MRRSIAVLFASAALVACAQPTEAPPAAASEAAAPVASNSGPADYTGTAVIEAIEDAGFPLYVVTARLPSFATPVTLTLDYSEAALPQGDLQALVGESVTLRFATVASNDLLFAKAGGAVVFGEDGVAYGGELATASGVLSDAEAVTAGDLPDLVTVTESDGTAITLQAFITPELAASNGQVIDITYRLGRERKITSIAPAR